MPFGSYHIKYPFDTLYDSIALDGGFIRLAKAPFTLEYNPSQSQTK